MLETPADKNLFSITSELDDMDAPLVVRIELGQMILRIRPATELTLYLQKHKDLMPQDYQDYATHFENYLKITLGLEVIVVDKGSAQPTFLVAQNKEYMNQLQNLILLVNNNELNYGDPYFIKTYGTLMGYPITAVESFANDETLTFAEIDAFKEKGEYESPVFWVSLSRDPVKRESELKIIRRWQEEVEMYFPTSYAELKLFA